MGLLRSSVVASLAVLPLLGPSARAGERVPATVAFRSDEGRAKIEVRGGTSAAILRPSPTLAVVHVAGAKAPRRIDRLPLDTTAFRGPVVRVDVKGTPGGLDIRLHVAKGAAVTTREAGGAIAIDVVGSSSEADGAAHDE